jgi:hypothetical protein
MIGDAAHRNRLARGGDAVIRGIAAYAVWKGSGEMENIIMAQEQ